MKRDDLLDAYEASRSLNDLAARLGCHYSTARKKVVKKGLEVPAPHWGRNLIEPEDPSDELSNEDLMAMCDERGLTVLRDPMREDREHELKIAPIDGQGTIKIGLVSDTHGGSRYQQLTYLHSAYDYFERNEIPDVLHTGDWTAGSDRMHPGMSYEVFAHGGDEQAEYVAEHYPSRPGITTHGISGNHDHSHMKANGQNVLKAIAKERPDIKYLGMSGAYMTINGIRFYLHHPSGGVAYARSYRLQKIIEQFSPENKPKVLICGHWHTTCLLEAYRNVYAMALPCFESQTPYLVEKGLYPETGWATLEVTYDDDGAVDFLKGFKPIYVPLKHDYGH